MAPYNRTMPLQHVSKPRQARRDKLELAGDLPVILLERTKIMRRAEPSHSALTDHRHHDSGTGSQNGKYLPHNHFLGFTNPFIFKVTFFPFLALVRIVTVLLNSPGRPAGR